MSHCSKWSFADALALVALSGACVAGACATASQRPAPRSNPTAHPAQADDLHRFSYRRVVMGSPCTLTLYAPTEADADEAAKVTFERLATIEEALSDWMVRGETTRLPLKAGQTVPTSPDLTRVLQRCDEAWRGTDGAFDPTVGPLVAVWRKARKAGAPPTDEQIAAAMKCIGWKFVTLGTHPPSFTPQLDGMRLDFGAIGQGYGAAEAMATLRQHGVTRALIDLSGDIAAGDAPPGTAGWRVEIGPQTVLLRNQAVTISGDAVQHLDEARPGSRAVRHSHIVSPTTGRALTTRMSVAVIAPDPVVADFLATALSVLGPEHRIPAGTFDFAAQWTIEQPEGAPVVVRTQNWPESAPAAP